jgi:hypothetical protein
MTLRLNGSTSGYTEIDAPAVAGSNTLVLPTGAGTSGQVLTTNGSGALSWAGAGKILQVVNVTYSISTTNSTTTYVDTGLTATITPASASNKVLIFVNQVGCGKDSASDTYFSLRLLRGSTSLIEFEKFGAYEEVVKKLFLGSCSTTYLDSPSTTSATTYKTQLARAGTAGTLGVQLNGGVSTITLMEVAA